MDIGSNTSGPAGDLSNFTPHAFTFCSVECASMEGFLQSLKFRVVADQKAVCCLWGVQAKRRGRARNKVWQAEQTLWWQGDAYDRHSEEYQVLLTAGFWALARNKDFRKALLATGNARLTHSIGSTDPRETILTEEEFCSKLMAMRAIMQMMSGKPEVIPRRLLPEARRTTF